MRTLPPEIAARLGSGFTMQRQAREDAILRSKLRGGLGGWRKLLRPPEKIRAALTLAGLWDRAHAEFLDVRIVEHRVALAGLPGEFHGFRLVQITDLHSDLEPALIGRVTECLSSLVFDQAVLTGDYHNEIGTPWDEALALTLRLVPHLGPRPLAILGNHDFLAQVPVLEAGGLRVLLNENAPIERGSARLWICGVDDAHAYGTDDLHAASAGIPAGECRILLSHSPETARAAAGTGYALHLNGHTHGGQICLPGGFPLVRRSPVRRALLAGPWREGGMPGYTSRGTGGCTVAARLHCPPEITVHILECA